MKLVRRKMKVTYKTVLTGEVRTVRDIDNSIKLCDLINTKHCEADAIKLLATSSRFINSMRNEPSTRNMQDQIRVQFTTDGTEKRLLTENVKARFKRLDCIKTAVNQLRCTTSNFLHHMSDYLIIV